MLKGFIVTKWGKINVILRMITQHWMHFDEEMGTIWYEDPSVRIIPVFIEAREDQHTEIVDQIANNWTLL